MLELYNTITVSVLLVRSNTFLVLIKTEVCPTLPDKQKFSKFVKQVSEHKAIWKELIILFINDQNCEATTIALQRNTRNYTNLHFYTTHWLSQQCYMFVTWTMRTRNLSKVYTTEIECFRSVKGCTRADHVKNNDTKKEMKIF